MNCFLLFLLTIKARTLYWFSEIICVGFFFNLWISLQDSKEAWLNICYKKEGIILSRRVENSALDYVLSISFPPRAHYPHWPYLQEHYHTKHDCRTGKPHWTLAREWDGKNKNIWVVLQKQFWPHGPPFQGFHGHPRIPGQSSANQWPQSPGEQSPLASGCVWWERGTWEPFRVMVIFHSVRACCAHRYALKKWLKRYA